MQPANNNSVDSFLSLKWGGIIISNPTSDECSKWMSNQEKVDVFVNSHNVMHTALFLLRRIIDIHVDVSCIIESGLKLNGRPVESKPRSLVTRRIWQSQDNRSFDFPCISSFRLRFQMQTSFLGKRSHLDHGKSIVIYESVPYIWLVQLPQRYSHSFNYWVIIFLTRLDLFSFTSNISA